MLAVQANNHEVMTVEGLAQGGQMHPLQQAFWEKQGLQCGFCTPGVLMTAYELLQRNPNPDEAEIRSALSGNMCRCTGYEHIVDAVRLAAQSLQERTTAPISSGTTA
jgi:carbon-monoxide dehydrogenase small subunit